MRFAATALFLLIGAHAVLADEELVTCGQHVSDGFLSQDLDCTGQSGPAVVVEGGTLDLAAFSIIAGDGNGVECNANCTIFSDPPGGRITGALVVGNSGIKMFAPGTDAIVRDVTIENHSIGIDGRSVRLERVTLRSNTFGARAGKITAVDSLVEANGTVALEGATNGFDRGTVRIVNTHVVNNTGDGVESWRVELEDSVVSSNGARGVYGQSRVKAARSVVSGNSGVGVSGWDMRLSDCEISDNGEWGVISHRLGLENTAIEGNGRDGVDCYRAKISDSSVSGNGQFGVHCAHARLNSATVSDNGLGGVWTLYRVKAVDTSLFSNDADASCGVTVTCADFVASSSPKLRGTTSCERSYVHDSGFPGENWGVCSLD